MLKGSGVVVLPLTQEDAELRWQNCGEFTMVSLLLGRKESGSWSSKLIPRRWWSFLRQGLGTLILCPSWYECAMAFSKRTGQSILFMCIGKQTAQLTGWLTLHFLFRLVFIVLMRHRQRLLLFCKRMSLDFLDHDQLYCRLELCFLNKPQELTPIFLPKKKRNMQIIRINLMINITVDFQNRSTTVMTYKVTLASLKQPHGDYLKFVKL